MAWETVKKRLYEWNGKTYAHSEQDLENPDYSKGIDCSELTEYAFKTSEGFEDIPDGARSQYLWCKKRGFKELSREEALKKEGALAFTFKTGSNYESGFSVPHVGIMLGNGQVFHAINGKMGVKATSCWKSTFHKFFDLFPSQSPATNEVNEPEKEEGCEC